MTDKTQKDIDAAAADASAYEVIPQNIRYIYCMTSSHLIKILQSDWSVAMQ